MKKNLKLSKKATRLLSLNLVRTGVRAGHTKRILVELCK